MMSATVFNIDQLHISIHADDMAQAATTFVLQTIQQAIAQRGTARVIFATGNSQLDFLQHLVRDTTIDWSRVTAFHLDEYLGLPPTHPASFRLYLNQRLFSQLPFGAVHLLNGDAGDPQAECERYTALLAEAPIDLACIGIGENGHLAFNDPPADFETPELVHIVTLDAACRRQQVGEGHFPDINAVPAQAITLSIPAIMTAQTISCVVPEARKAEAIQRALYEPISPDCPASILRQHENARLFLDQGSAGQLR